MDKKNKEVLKKALDKYGDMQMIVAIEELSELQKELTKHLRDKGNKTHIAEEVADVKIMIEQIEMYFGISGMVKSWTTSKIDRLERTMKKE